MSPHTAPSPVVPGPPAPFSRLLPRNESLLVVACHPQARLHTGTTATAGRSHPATPVDGTLLICAGSRSVALWGVGCELHATPSGLSRLLAFHDHALNINRPLPGDRRHPTLVAARHDLRDTQTARDWLMDRLLDRDEAVARCASALAVCEPYQLVRFVLENPDLSVQQLADRYGLSVAQFRRIGKKAFERSLKEQLRLLRAGRVLQRYAETGQTFTRLSSDFGFSSPSHFCSEIKSLLGRSPSSIYQSVHSQ